MDKVDAFVEELSISLYFFGTRLQAYASAEARGVSKAQRKNLAAAAIEALKFSAMAAGVAKRTFINNRTKMPNAALDIIVAYASFIDALEKDPNERERLYRLASPRGLKELSAYLFTDSKATSKAQTLARLFVSNVKKFFKLVEDALALGADAAWKQSRFATKFSVSLVISAAWFYINEVGRADPETDKLRYTNQIKREDIVNLLKGPVRKLIIYPGRKSEPEEVLNRAKMFNDQKARAIADDFLKRKKLSGDALFLLGDE